MSPKTCLPAAAVRSRMQKTRWQKYRPFMSTSSIIGLSAGFLFLAVAGANVWLVLESSRSHDVMKTARLMRNHRLLGYAFLALFAVMFFYMSLRVLGAKGGLPAPIILHIALALVLVPLLLLKVVIVRYYKKYSALLLPLGLAIFVLSFLLVSIAAFPELLAALIIGKIPVIVSAGVIAAATIVFGSLFLRPARMTSSELPASSQAVDRIESAGRIAGTVPPPAAGSLMLLLARIDVQTHDTKTLRFLLPTNARFSPRPGQFMSFSWIINGKKVPRCYSICSSPSQSSYIEITPKKAPHGHVSVFLNQQAEVGLIVEASGPFGQFCFDESRHKDIVFIAGGSGITPMISMLRYIDDRCLPTNVTLFYFVRSPQDVIFDKELEALESSIKNFRRIIIAGAPAAGWRGPTGHLNADLLTSNLTDLEHVTFFLCGPPGLMESGRKILNSLGVSEARIRQESFGGQPSTAPGELAATDDVVDFVRSHKTCKVLRNKTLLEIAEINDVFIPSSCRQGQCGTCAVRVLRGSVRMDREEGLSKDYKDRGYVLTCVGRPQGTVELDA